MGQRERQPRIEDLDRMADHQLRRIVREVREAGARASDEQIELADRARDIANRRYRTRNPRRRPGQ